MIDRQTHQWKALTERKVLMMVYTHLCPRCAVTSGTWRIREKGIPPLKPLCHTSHHPGAHVASGRDGKRHNQVLQQEASGAAIADRVAAGRDTARPHTPDEGA